MATRITGTFDVQLQPEPPYDTDGGVTLGLTTIKKRFHGPLDATSHARMLSARGPVPGSAGYVAIERVTGTVDGHAGSFILQHNGTMDRGVATLLVHVVPDTGTEGLTGLRGTMTIEITAGVHHYVFDYTLSE